MHVVSDEPRLKGLDATRLNRAVEMVVLFDLFDKPMRELCDAP